MDRPSVARRDQYRLHPVMLALGKARAAVTLADVCAQGSDYLQLPRTADEGEDRAWIQGIAFDAIRCALAEADDAFRKSLTPEQAHAQVIGGPPAVA
jgi:hypothetical protein